MLGGWLVVVSRGARILAAARFDRLPEAEAAARHWRREFRSLRFRVRVRIMRVAA